MDQYFVALLPSEEIREQVKSLKEEIREKYQSKRALRLPAHITLQPPFKMTEEQIPHFLEIMEDFAHTQESFKVELSGFGAFRPRVLFIELSHPGSVKHLHKALHEVMMQIFRNEPSEKKRKFRPHITLATRDLRPGQFEEAWKEFQKRDFKAAFNADSLVIFRHNGRTLDIFRRFPFNS